MKKQMKNNKGITLTSLVIYIAVMFVVLVTITRVIIYFRNNMNDVADVTVETQIEKLNLYFIDEANKNGNKIIPEDFAEGTAIEFSSGNKYEYKDKAIFLNNSIKICENVESCLFKKRLTDNGKDSIEITITIKDTTKTFKYVMTDIALENEIAESDYTNSIIAKEYMAETNSVTINNTIGQNVVNYRIYGNCYQEGTPTPQNPIEVQCVGDLVTDTSDENYGKYLIPITASNGEKTETVNIYLDEPLRSITYSTQTATDYIDFETKQIIRNVWQTTLTGSEEEIWTFDSGKKDYEYITIRYTMLPKTMLFARKVFSNQYKDYYTLWNYPNSELYWKISLIDIGNRVLISLQNEIIGVPLEVVEEDSGEARDNRTAAVKQFLQNNNFYVIYSIAEPDIQTIDLPPLPSFKGTTTYTVGTSLAPSDFYIKVPINDL